MVELGLKRDLEGMYCLLAFARVVLKAPPVIQHSPESNKGQAVMKPMRWHSYADAVLQRLNFGRMMAITELVDASQAKLCSPAASWPGC